MYHLTEFLVYPQHMYLWRNKKKKHISRYPSYLELYFTHSGFNPTITLNIEVPYHTILMANSADPDQTAPLEQFDMGLHCLLIGMPCPNI